MHHIEYYWWKHSQLRAISRVSCQKGPNRHAYAWQIGPFWQDTLEMAHYMPYVVEINDDLTSVYKRVIYAYIL